MVNHVIKSFLSLLSLSALLCFQKKVVVAQIVPDSTLGREENSQVIRNVQIRGINSDRIEGGAIRGSNLFHSFSEFNVAPGRGTYFSNPIGVTNIWNRVTGGNPSNILGTLGVLGDANLFLINPNGIFFGSGAKLDISGSFTGTTAVSVDIDGLEYSSSNPQAVPIKMNFPRAFGFDRVTFDLTEASGDISVQGSGHNLTDPDFTFDPVTIGNNQSQLKVAEGQNINFISKNIDLNGGNINTPAGTTNLYALKNGQITLNLDNLNRWNFAASPNAVLGNIIATNRSSVDASGTPNRGGGSILAIAETLTLLDGSVFIIENFNNSPSGDINLNTKNTILSGVAGNRVASGLFTQNFGTGKSPGTLVNTDVLRLDNGAAITSASFSSSSPGTIEIKGRSLVEVDGFFPFLGTQVLTGISSLSSSNNLNTKGKILIETRNLILRDGAAIITISQGKTNASDLFVNAGNIEINGTTPNQILSNLGSITFAEGNAGSVEINAENLTILNGAGLTNSTIGTGNAGKTRIRATNITIANSPQTADLVRGLSLADSSALQVPLSNISSSAVSNSPQIDLFTGSPIFLTGDAGTIEIVASNLKILNGAGILVFNIGTGRGGTITITADNIEVANASGINASTFSGNGGNITINSRDLRVLDDSSIAASVGFIDAIGNAFGGGDGGNIFLYVSPGTIVLRNSFINANAVFGSGGRIEIATSTIFSNRPLAEAIQANSLFGQPGVLQVTITGTTSRNLISAQIQQIEEKISSLAKNECVTPQRSGTETVDLTRYGSPTGTFEVKNLNVHILGPREEDPNEKLINRFILEPHVIVTEEEGSQYLGILCFSKS